MKVPYLTANKTPGCISSILISAGQITKKKQSTTIKRDEINIMNIINDNTFNLYNSFLNNDTRYVKATLKSKLIGVARELISADYREF